MKANITKDMIDAISKKQIEVLQKWWDANATLPMKMQAEGKTMKGALAFIRSVARKVAQDGMTMISDEDTYGLLVHYMADEPEGATYGDTGKNAPPPPKETEEQKLAKMTDEERKAYIERKNAEAKAKEAAEAERKRKLAERTAREAAKAAKAEALKKAAEAQLLFNLG